MRKISWVVAAVLAVSVTASAAGPSFAPDYKFTGSSTKGWHSLGSAKWSANQGVITGTPAANGGGWLVSDDSLQDISVYTAFRCEAECETGILLRAEKTPGGGLKGVYVSFTDAAMTTSAVTIDSNGAISKREQLPPGAGTDTDRSSACDLAGSGKASSSQTECQSSFGATRHFVTPERLELCRDIL